MFAMNRVEIGSFIYTEFGKLTDWAEDDYGIDIISGENVVRKSKKYPSWKNTAEKIKDHMGKPVVYRTTASHVFSPDKYFNDIILDDNFFEIAEDAGAKAREQIFMLKITYENRLYYLEKRSANDMLLLQAQIDEQDETEVAKTTKQLDKDWDKMLRNSETEFVIYGAAYKTDGLPRHVNRTMMMRYGIDTMHMKRISVTLKHRVKDNLVMVELPDNDEQECLVALVRGNNKDTRGSWVIKSALPVNQGKWFKHEKEEWKNARNQPISFFREKYDFITSKIK